MPAGSWSLLGSLATEERCLAVWTYLRSGASLTRACLVEVRDLDSLPFKTRVEQKLQARRAEFFAAGGGLAEVEAHGLFASHGEIVKIADDFAVAAGSNIIIDISCLPKRFFFPFVKRLLSKAAIRNVLVTYTRPIGYTSDELAENYQEAQSLPLFGGKYPGGKAEIVVVSVGYMTGGLPEQIEKYGSDVRVKLLFPFPPGPPSFQRNWRVVRLLEKNLSEGVVEVVPIDAVDMADAFDHIVCFTEGGKRVAVFAPYGPKPTCLAMCLYASATDAAVYYTQPTAYHPDYSSGVSMVDGQPEAFAYCVRLDGRNLYEVT